MVGLRWKLKLDGLLEFFQAGLDVALFVLALIELSTARKASLVNV